LLAIAASDAPLLHENHHPRDTNTAIAVAIAIAIAIDKNRNKTSTTDNTAATQPPLHCATHRAHSSP
jgi:hypothetical protein